MVMRMSGTARKLPEGTQVQFTTDIPDSDVLKGDIGTLTRVTLPRGRGFEYVVVFDDGSSAQVESNTQFFVTQVTPEEAAAQKEFYGRIGRGARSIGRGIGRGLRRGAREAGRSIVTGVAAATAPPRAAPRQQQQPYYARPAPQEYPRQVPQSKDPWFGGGGDIDPLGPPPDNSPIEPLG